MLIYIVVTVLLLYLSYYYDISGKRVGRDGWYNAVLVFLILIAGLRWRVGTDTIAYLARFYHIYPTLENFAISEYGLGQDPFYALINVIVKTLGGRFYMVQIIQATIVNVLVFKYIKRHSKYIFTCVLFYFFINYLNYNMETMRASISIAICLFGNDYIMEKKWLKGYLLYIIACLFHYQTLVILLLPSLYRIRFNKYGIMLFVAAFVTGFFLKSIIEDYMFLLGGNEILEEKVEDKIYSDRWGDQRGNLNYFIGVILIKIVYPITAFLIIRKYSKKQDIIRLEPFVILCVMFVFIQLNISIAFRYVYYFEIYFAIIYSEVFANLLPWLLHKKRQFVVSLLFFFPVLLYHFNIRYSSHLYHPYTSVIEMSVDQEKERALQYKFIYSPPNRNEY